MVAPPPRISKSISSHGIYSMTLEVGNMIIDVSPHNRLKPDFSISPQRALLGRRPQNFEIDHLPRCLFDCSGTWYDD